jgi:hypothetical protein
VEGKQGVAGISYKIRLGRSSACSTKKFECAAPVEGQSPLGMFRAYSRERFAQRVVAHVVRDHIRAVSPEYVITCVSKGKFLFQRSIPTG